MKRILLILNGNLTPPHVMDSAINIAQTTSSLLHVVFVDSNSKKGEYSYFFPNDLSLTENNLTGKTIAEENAALLASNIQLFKDECAAAGVTHYIEPGGNTSLPDLLEYSAFSDLILADGHEDLDEHYMKELLAKTHCPLYLLSKSSEKTQTVVLAYDGTISSIHAIKLYSYVLPEFHALPTYLVYIAPEKNAALPHEQHIKMWLSNRFSNLEIKILHGHAPDELVNLTASIPHSLVVMGSFGRSFISRFFHGSLAKNVIEKINSSVFISHK